MSFKRYKPVVFVIAILVVNGIYSSCTASLVVDTFTNCLSSENPTIPCGWYPTQKDVSMFSIRHNQGNYYVNIKTRGGNTTIGTRFNYDLSEHPFLSWKWRVHELPQDACESLRRAADSGAGVYVIFKGKFKLNKMIKYVWSSSLPVGTLTKSPFNSRTRIRVLQSGGDKSGNWVTERVNVLTDYEQLFGSSPPMVEAIAIMSDADNTESSVEADYDDFRIGQ